MKKRYLILILLISATFLAKAQNSGVVQFSGTLNSSDTAHKPIPFVTVYDLHTSVISVSNYQGFFSIVVNEGDTIQFSCLGFKPRWYIIPKGVNQEKMATALYLEPAYLMLREAIVYPWGSRDQFPNAFVHTSIPDDDLARATRNLNPDIIRTMIANAPADPNINSRMVLTNYAKALYYYGQPQPISLLNPLAWAQFISDLKNGRYKNTTPTNYGPDINNPNNTPPDQQ